MGFGRAARGTAMIHRKIIHAAVVAWATANGLAVTARTANRHT